MLVLHHRYSDSLFVQSKYASPSLYLSSVFSTLTINKKKKKKKKRKRKKKKKKKKNFFDVIAEHCILPPYDCVKYFYIRKKKKTWKEHSSSCTFFTHPFSTKNEYHLTTKLDRLTGNFFSLCELLTFFLSISSFFHRLLLFFMYFISSIDGTVIRMSELVYITYNDI